MPQKSKEPETKEWFVAIDPGKCNFAFIIEEIDSEMLNDIVCPPKKERFHLPEKKKRGDNGEPTHAYTSFLEQFYHCGKTILCENNDITGGSKSKKLDVDIFLRLTELLDKYTEYWDKCNTIIIEQQMSFGRLVNTMAIKIAQHTYSYFLFRYGNTKNIIEFPSYHKTQLLGAPAGLAKPKRKKWAIEKADEIWTLRGDMDSTSKVGSKKKKDDMSDCLLHVLSYIILTKYG